MSSKSRHKLKKRRRINKLFFYHEFPEYEDVQAYLRDLAKDYPGSVKVETVGFSFKARHVDMIIIKKDLNEIKHSVLIDGGIHAREWISITSVLYIISRIVKDPKLLNLMDFYIIPVLNPDGYIYTHTTDRMWRKNLNNNYSESVKEWGVDINRNFPFAFGQEGSSSDKKSFMYRGTGPLSEKEAQALANVIKKYGAFIKLYITFHSYGNCIMYPWGHTKRVIFDKEVLHECALAARAAMHACKGRSFRVGSVANTKYVTSGSSLDYLKGFHKIKFCYAIELEKFGSSGYTPSARNIIEIGRECMEGLEAMIKFIKEYYKKNPKEN